MKYYYKIWSDAIFWFDSPKFYNDWKFYTLMYISLAMAFNIATFWAITSRLIFGNNSYFLVLNIFPGDKLDNALSGFLIYMLLPVLVNYYLIFRNSKYKSLVIMYSHRQGKLAKVYIITSIFAPLVLLVIGFLIG